MRYQRLSNVIKKPERDIFIDSRLNLPNNLKIISMRTPMTSKSADLRPLRRFKPNNFQFL
jgi:hypothetical protein